MHCIRAAAAARHSSFRTVSLEGGRLVQTGTHEELLKQDGLYKRIADIQNLLEDELRSEQEEN